MCGGRGIHQGRRGQCSLPDGLLQSLCTHAPTAMVAIQPSRSQHVSCQHRARVVHGDLNTEAVKPHEETKEVTEDTGDTAFRVTGASVGLDAHAVEALLNQRAVIAGSVDRTQRQAGIVIGRQHNRMRACLVVAERHQDQLIGTQAPAQSRAIERGVLGECCRATRSRCRALCGTYMCCWARSGARQAGWGWKRAQLWRVRPPGGLGSHTNTTRYQRCRMDRQAAPGGKRRPGPSQQARAARTCGDGAAAALPSLRRPGQTAVSIGCKEQPGAPYQESPARQPPEEAAGAMGLTFTKLFARWVPGGRLDAPSACRADRARR